ncbi:unnamed protein product [Phyllotreta striolata]|uniref:Epoxide hydrolase n=1 Tax=Phyllotreta striolata TaxID=444603 RepID=A0A9N9TGZ5_PHYSR|nr:unnamed protein product [Phyllotreta striolata]
MWKLLSLVVLVVVFVFLYVKTVVDFNKNVQVEETWWKLTKPLVEDTVIKPFKINVSNETLNDLKERLQNALPFEKSLTFDQNYGINEVLLNTVIDFWKKQYRWREREVFLNKYPQYFTNIQGLDIHYIHVKSSKCEDNNKVVTLLLLHGWPGSIRDFYELISLLEVPDDGRKFSFEIIVPSLPGYGFSEAPELPGLSTPQMAVILKNLMSRLNIEKYYIHGVDWGAFIASHMAALYPEKITGVHSSVCWLNVPSAYARLVLFSAFPSLILDGKYEHLVYPLVDKVEFFVQESGYLHLQATKPDTIGIALRDNPIGLAAYITEKFSTWSNPAWRNLDDGGISKYDLNKILDNIMIYWITGSITTSLRLYKEYFNQLDLSLSIDSLRKSRYKNLISLRTHENAGHFAQYEAPEVLARDIGEFIRIVEESRSKFHHSSLESN